MSLAIVYTRASIGIDAPLVTVETHISNGLSGLSIVGLAEAAVKESKDRVRSALLNSHFEFPARKITINLAPADLPKEGGSFDLAIAIGILAASKQIPQNLLAKYEFLGELGLSGELRPCKCILPIAIAVRKAQRQLIIPTTNADEAAVIDDRNVLIASHLLEVCSHLKTETQLKYCSKKIVINQKNYLDLSEVKGQQHAKRALEIAAAGRHSLLFIGPPGTGKTMLASRLPGILPALNEDEALQVASIASISRNGFDVKDWRMIPFRAPHHTSSAIAIVGGGRPPKPGEISLSHHGVLFLDELPEFSRHVLECLREPLESGCITISRASYQTSFPARFQLIAAMNPCPCGFAGSMMDHCQCSQEQIKRYLGKLSGPLLDRIDMQVEVPKLITEIYMQYKVSAEDSKTIAKRVSVARGIQYKRQQKCNAFLTPSELNQSDDQTKEAYQLFEKLLLKYHFSVRSFHRLLRIARTIADLEGEVKIDAKHISEALSYRTMDKFKTMIT